jgi:hypothetical protein
MDQGGGTDEGKLTSLPPLRSLEEPAAWLVGALDTCPQAGCPVWGAGNASALGGRGGLARRKNLNLTWRDIPPLPVLVTEKTEANAIWTFKSRSLAPGQGDTP